MESDGSKEKVIEPYGSLWKMQESSIGKLAKREGKQPRVKYKKGKEGLGKRKGAVYDTSCLKRE